MVTLLQVHISFLFALRGEQHFGKVGGGMGEGALCTVGVHCLSGAASNKPLDARVNPNWLQSESNR